MKSDIEQELDYLNENYPDFAQGIQRVKAAIETGHIQCDLYSDPESGCGCFYGHLLGLSEDYRQIAAYAACVVQELEQRGQRAQYGASPIEEFLVEYCTHIGETNKTSWPLEDFYTILSAYAEREAVKERVSI